MSKIKTAWLLTKFVVLGSIGIYFAYAVGYQMGAVL